MQQLIKKYEQNLATAEEFISKNPSNGSISDIKREQRIKT